jgi:hypothetical protein
MKISVKTLQGKQLPIEVEESLTVFQLVKFIGAISKGKAAI